MARIPWTVNSPGLSATMAELAGVSGFKAFNKRAEQIASEAMAVKAAKVLPDGSKRGAFAFNRSAGGGPRTAPLAVTEDMWTAGQQSSAEIVRLPPSGTQMSLFDTAPTTAPSPSVYRKQNGQLASIAKTTAIQNSEQPTFQHTVNGSRRVGGPAFMPGAPHQQMELDLGVKNTPRPEMKLDKASPFKAPADAGTKAVNEGGWKGAIKGLGKGIIGHMGDTGTSYMKQAMFVGGASGLVGGIATGMGAMMDPEHFQSNGIVKPMLQGAFKGAILGAASAAAGGLTRATKGTQYEWLSKGAKMTHDATRHWAVKPALAMAAFAGAGNVNFTSPVNPIK